MIRKLIGNRTDANEKGIHQKFSFFRRIPIMYISPSGRYLIFNFVLGKITNRLNQCLYQRRHSGADDIFSGLCKICMSRDRNPALPDTYCNQSHHSFTVPVIPRRREIIWITASLLCKNPVFSQHVSLRSKPPHLYT